jgi:hypothetical protein
MTLQLGQARITPNPQGFIITWRNVGNFLSPIPRCFRSRGDAEAFIRERGLELVK